MNLSPGVELVWALAGRETIAAQNAEIEPEHFFCALLKFSEMQDSELDAVVVRPGLAKHLAVERDQVRSMLTANALPTTLFRHELRHVLGPGKRLPRAGETLHRSDASRRLFEQATQKSSGAIEAQHLLKILLNAPTPSMQQALKTAIAKSSQPVTTEQSPLMANYTQDILRLARGDRFETPPAAAPQVQTLDWALRSKEHAHLLLPCAPDVKSLLIVGCAFQQLLSPMRLLGVDHAALRRDSYDVDLYRSQVSSLVAEAADIDNLALFFEATKLPSPEILILLDALKPNLIDTRPRLVVAIREDGFPQIVETHPDLNIMFRTIWLHQLRDLGVPTQV